MTSPSLTSTVSSGLPSHIVLTGPEGGLFDFFSVICAREFALFLDSTIWEDLIVRLVLFEPFAYHTALSIGALSKLHYLPMQHASSPLASMLDWNYSMIQYSLAIETLNARLDHSSESAELAVLGSILFANVEFLSASDGHPQPINPIGVHVLGGQAVLQSVEGTGYPRISQSWHHLKNALAQIQAQREASELIWRVNEGNSS